MANNTMLAVQFSRYFFPVPCGRVITREKLKAKLQTRLIKISRAGVCDTSCNSKRETSNQLQQKKRRVRPSSGLNN